MKVLAVCGAGMGTSLMVKMKLAQFAEKEGLDIFIESCGLDEGKGSLREYDILICPKHLVEELEPIPDSIQLIAVSNMIDVSSYGEKVKAIVNGA